MNTLRALLAVILGFAALPAQAEPSYVPERGSAIRTAICDAVRRDQQTPKAKYEIIYLRVQGDWALFDGTPTTPSGRLQDLPDEGATVAAVLQRRDGRWTVAGSWRHNDVAFAEDFKTAASAVPASLLKEYAAKTP